MASARFEGEIAEAHNRRAVPLCSVYLTGKLTTVVLSILFQLIRTKAEPELLLEPTADGLGYGPLGIGPLDT